MNYKFFNNCDEMLTYYFENGMDTCFSLVLEQIEKDDCYLDDDWIQWCVVEFEEGDSVQPLALIGTRRVPCVMNSTHISSFEVNINYRGLGFGKMILKEFMDTYCKDIVTLYAEDKNRGFYEKLGFVKQTEPYFYVKDDAQKK